MKLERDFNYFLPWTHSPTTTQNCFNFKTTDSILMTNILQYKEKRIKQMKKLKGNWFQLTKNPHC